MGYEYEGNLTPSSGVLETPERTVLPDVSLHKDLAAVAKELHEINKNLAAISKAIRLYGGK